MEEQRESHRARTLRGGKIWFNHRRSLLDCMIRNLSPEGACLQVESLVGVPPEFDLLIDGEDTPRPCRLVWQSHERAGVQFTAGRSEVAPSEPPHARAAAPRAGSDLRRLSPDAAGSSPSPGRSRSR